MRSHELTIGRTFALALDDGEDFLPTLIEFCRRHGVKQGYIPTFIAGFAEASIVGTCEKLDNPHAPVFKGVHLTAAEALGSGTLAYDPDSDSVLPHIHTTLGEKARSATGHTSHLLSATVQLLAEMIVVEATSPLMTRRKSPQLYDVPLLNFGIGPDS